MSQTGLNGAQAHRQQCWLCGAEMCGQNHVDPRAPCLDNPRYTPRTVSGGLIPIRLIAARDPWARAGFKRWRELEYRRGNRFRIGVSILEGFHVRWRHGSVEYSVPAKSLTEAFQFIAAVAPLPPHKRYAAVGYAALVPHASRSNLNVQ